MPFILCLVHFLAGSTGPRDLRVETAGQGRKVKVVARIPNDLLAKVPAGALDQDEGEKWLRLTLTGKDREGPPMLGSYRRNDTKLIFIPRFPLEPGRTYRARFGPPGQAGKFLDYRVPDRPAAPLAVVEKVYPSADVLPANHLRFFIHFSAPMRGGQEIFDQIRILDAKGEPVDDPWLRDELWDDKGKMLILYIHPGRIKWGVLLRLLLGPVLVPDQQYTLVLSPDLLDANGQRLVKEYRQKFRTTAEDRTRIAVEDWKIQSPQAGTRKPVVVAFPKVMDHSSLSRFLSIRSGKNQPILGKIEIARGERCWSFVPAEPWRPGQYRLGVDEQFEDLAGNTPLRPFDMDRNSRPAASPKLRLGFEVR